MPAHEPGVPRCAACHDGDVTDSGAVGGRQVEPVQTRRPVLEHETTAERAAHGFRLLGDLFLHEVRVPVQLDRLEIPGNIVDGAQLHV